MINNFEIPEELKSCMKIQENTFYVLHSYKATPLFLSFKKNYERRNGDVTVIPILAEELNFVAGNLQSEKISSQRIVNLYTRIFREAAMKNASDIHISLFTESHTDIYFRLNGKLTRQLQLSAIEGYAVMRSIYQTVSMSDVSYRDNEYQAGQIHSFDDVKSIPEGVHSIRIQRGPMLGGYYMVLRLLYKDAFQLENKVDKKGSIELGFDIFKNYGYTQEQANILANAAHKPQGMVIFSGPTGSGKSTALKTALEFQNMIYPDKAIYTIEDPPEFPIKGAKQLYVLNAGTEEIRSSKFAESLRVAMRSDPDILMVGEIRDEATASVSVDAVITGHQMWTTIHALDVFAIISRLLRFGINKDDLLDEKLLNVLIGQRLLPRLCDNCKLDFDENLLDLDLFTILMPVASSVKLVNKEGCEKCHYTGIMGRLLVAETLTVTEDLIENIKSYGLTKTRRDFNLNEYTMIKHAYDRILKGEVDPRDVISSVGDIKGLYV